MQDIFYDYDYRIDQQEYLKPPICCPPPAPKQGCTEARILKNFKGESIGISIKQNAKATLYFTLDGLSDLAFELNATKDELSAEKRVEFTFEVLSHKLKPIATFPVSLSSGSASVDIVTNDQGPLKYGNYRMHLYVTIPPIEGIGEPMKYTLFSPTDGILSVE